MFPIYVFFIISHSFEINYKNISTHKRYFCGKVVYNRRKKHIFSFFFTFFFVNNKGTIT